MVDKHVAVRDGVCVSTDRPQRWMSTSSKSDAARTPNCAAVRPIASAREATGILAHHDISRSSVSG